MPKTSRRTASSHAGTSTPARGPAPRPAAAARGRRPSQEQRAPRSVKNIAILASVFVMLAITLIPALRATFNQQSQINGLRERIAQQRQSVAALQQEQRQWADPAYVEQQARERLKLVRVGDKPFTVIDGSGASVLAGDTGAQIVAPAKTSAADIPWYGQLWASVEIADNPADAVTGQPQTSPAPVPAAP